MADVWKIIAVLAVLIILLRRKMNLGIVMLIGAVILALFYLTPPVVFLKGIYTALMTPSALEMTATLIFTMIMENILRKTETLRCMVESLSELLPDARLIMAAMPAMIGMLPSPGGAVFSAPMVKEASAHLTITADQKAFINYWYRHIWEYVSPLYPGIILLSGLSHIPYRDLARANASFALAVVLVGVVFCFAGIGPGSPLPSPRSGRVRAAGTFSLAIAPILLTLVMVVIGRVNPVIAMGAVTVVLYAVHRYPPAKIAASLRESVSINALFLVAGIMIFQETLRVTGALPALSLFFTRSGLSPYLVLTTVPFLAGLMTGLTIAFIGITFPVLLPLMGGTTPPLGLVALAFGSGFAGVMLSPVHLCLVLTRDYFNADLARVYHRLIIPSALVLSSAAIPLFLYP